MTTFKSEIFNLGRDHLALEVPEYDILAVTVDGRLFEYAKENRGWAWKWSQI